jgi:hypothetical protein
VCRGAEATRARRYRARNPRAQTRIPNVVALPTSLQPDTAAQPGEVEQAVRAQLADMPKAEQRQGEAAAAIRLAQLLDNPDYYALAAQNSYKLHTLLASLAGPRKKLAHRGRLATVAAMTAPKQRTAQ